MHTLSFNTFSGGIVNDPRSPDTAVARVVTNFDALTDSFRLRPYHSSEDGDNAASTSQKQNFCVAHWLPGSTNVWRLFSLGVVSGTGKAEILMKDLTTGASNDLHDNTWASPSNNQSASGTTSFNLFVFYKKTGLIYGAKGGTSIWAFDPVAGAAFAESTHGLTYTNICQGVVHPADDILYIGYDNAIATNNNGSWNVTALTLPPEYYITSLSVHGNLLAIACAPLSGVGNSRVFLWDRDSSVATLTDNVDWGTGVIKVLDSIDGYLVGVSLDGGNATRTTDRIIFREYVGQGLSRPFSVLLGTTSAVIPIAKQVIDNRLYFMMSVTLNGSVREGVWSVGRPKGSTAFSIIHERTPNNDTALGAGVLKAFFYVGDFLFQSYVNNSGAYAVSKTDDAANYTQTAIYETVINPNQPEHYRASAGIRSSKKQVLATLLGTEPLPSGASATLKYKVDGGSWVTILTNSTLGSVAAESSAFDAAGTAITAGREYEFRLESTGGAVITEMKYKIEVNETLL